MIIIYLIITALVPTLAKGSMDCYLSECTEPQQCFGALGEPLIFHLPINVTDSYNIKLKKNKSTQILNKVNEAVTVHKDHINDFALFANGTLKLNNARRADSGEYKLEIFSSEGRSLYDINKRLEIQAPVSKPAVSQMCLSPDRMNISCSSEGEGVEFIFTFGGLFQIHTRDCSQSQNSSVADTLLLDGSSDNQHKPNVTISLYGQLTGNLMCTVRNNVSREETVIHLTSCKGSSSHLSLVTVAVIASVVSLLLLLALFLVIKHLNKKKMEMTVDEENSQEDEIVYSDVRVKKNTKKTRPSTHQNAT